jgi:pyroglutamyl-peptidase
VIAFARRRDHWSRLYRENNDELNPMEVHIRRPILITGFEPFAGQKRNPSGEAVLAASKTHIRSDLFEILPVEYSAAGRRLESWIEALNPMAWIGFGLNQKATAITLERVAVNLDDATIPDNAGDLRRGITIESAGADTYQSTLPLQSLETRLRDLQIPVTYSDSAGRFVCNHVFYTALSAVNRMKSDAQAGFIHLPWPSDWQGMPNQSHPVTFETIVLAVQTCISALLRNSTHQNKIPLD